MKHVSNNGIKNDPLAMLEIASERVSLGLNAPRVTLITSRPASRGDHVTFLGGIVSNHELEQ